MYRFCLCFFLGAAGINATTTTTIADTDFAQLTEQLRAVESECQAVKSELDNVRVKVIFSL